MPSVRGEITKTLLRLSRLADSRSGADLSAPRPPSSPLAALRQGSDFGKYRIEKLIGSGGMGQVYLATDSRLKRKVALKFLSPTLVADDEMLRRLLAEAQTASALNHPNILTIHEAGELDGYHYIASEFIDGETMRVAINRKAIDVQTAIDVVCQVLSALVAAHAAGVVHRDLKPGNIMIRPDGYAKVIDFGLAKRKRTPGEELSLVNSLTRPGLVVGTVYYMSPEQACGDTVDHRTDIWSLGIILFEAVTRKRPFDGESESRVVRNICSKPVPVIALRPDLPSGLLHVIERALAKDPDERYQSAREMLGELSTVGLVSTEPGSSVRKLSVAPLPPPRKTRLIPVLIGVLILLLCLAVGLGIRGSGWLGPRWLQLEPVGQLTFNGFARLARISPDGRYLAFVTGDENGSQSLYLRQVQSSAEELKIAPRNVQYAGLTFTPDSQSLLIVEKDGTKLGKLFAVPMMGPKSSFPLVVDIDGPVSFSPDGDRFAFVRYTQARKGARSAGAVYLASANGTGLHKLFDGGSADLFRRAVWSPKDNLIAVFGTSAKGDTELFLSDPAGKIRTFALPQWRRVGQPVWSSDARRIATTTATGIESDLETQVRQIDIRSGEQHDITHDLQGYRELSANADGTLYTAIRQESKARIWVSEPNDFAHGSSAGAENERYPSLSWFDSGRLVVNSRRNQYPNLWLFDVAAQTRSTLTDDPHVEQSAVAVPGRKSVVFVSNRSGGYHLWRFDSQTNQYHQLTSGDSYDEKPAIDPQGAWVYYNAWYGTSPQLRKVSVDGGESTRIGAFAAQDAHISPNGNSILCLLHDPHTLAWHTSILDVSGQAEPRLLPAARSLARWSPDGKSITTAITDPKGISNLWKIPLNSGKPVELTSFDDGAISDFEWSPDGDRIACLRINFGTDVVLFRKTVN